MYFEKKETTARIKNVTFILVLNDLGNELLTI